MSIIQDGTSSDEARARVEDRNNLDAIKDTLVDAPTMEHLREYLPGFVNATWAVNPMSSNALSTKEKDKLIKDAFFGKTLPTALAALSAAPAYTFTFDFIPSSLHTSSKIFPVYEMDSTSSGR